MTAADNGLAMQLAGQDREWVVNDIAHGQIAEHTGIPQKYYDRMREKAPELLATNVDAWFKKYPETRMVRMLDGRADSYLARAAAALVRVRPRTPVHLGKEHPGRCPP